MTFYSTLAGTDAHVDLVLALRIEGVPTALVERAIPSAVATSLTGYTQFVGITRVDEGEAVLDMQERRELAASLQIDLLDDAARTLSGLFAVNTRAVARIRSDNTAASTTLTFDTVGVASLSSGQVVYTDYETITLGTVSVGSANATGCTRGAFGSTAAAQWGESSANVVDGESVYSTPPAWRGRRAYLYGYTLRADGGGFEQLLGTWIIDEPPRHIGDDSWSLVLASIAQEYYERSVGLGLRTTQVVRSDLTYPTFSLVSDRPVITFKFDDPKALRVGTTFPTYVVALDSSDAPVAIFELYSVNTATGEVAFYTEPMFTENAGPGVPAIFTDKLRPVAICGKFALPFILMSNEGQGATSNDRLPGRVEQSINDPGWRLGAGFKFSEVDESISGIGAIANAAPEMTFVIDDQQPVSDVLREYCLLSDMATRVDNQGRLSMFSIASTIASSATTLGPNSIIPDSRVEVVADEASIFPLASVRCGYSPFTRDFSTEVNLLDAPTLRRYRRAQSTLELEFRSFGVSGLPDDSQPEETTFQHPPVSVIPIDQLPTMLEKLQRGDGGFARRLVRLSVTLAHADLRIGDVVTLAGLPDAFSRLPNMEGGTLEGARGRIIARRPRYDDGRIDIQIAILEPVVVVCPASVITGVSGTTLTISTSDDTAAIGQYFITGVGVRIYDVSAGTSHTTSISSIISTSQIVIGSSPGFAIELGVDYVVLSPYSGSTSTSATNIVGYGLSQMAVVVPTPPAAPTSGLVTTRPRWR